MRSMVAGVWKIQPAWVYSNETTEYMDEVSVRYKPLKLKRSAQSLAGHADRFSKNTGSTKSSGSSRICVCSLISITDRLRNTNLFLTKLNEVRGKFYDSSPF